MRRRTRAVLWAVVIILVFVAAPSIILWYMPSLAASMATFRCGCQELHIHIRPDRNSSRDLNILKNVIDD